LRESNFLARLTQSVDAGLMLKLWHSVRTDQAQPPPRFPPRLLSRCIERRVVAKVEHHGGELFPRVGFLVTNLTLPSWDVLRFYNKRVMAEQWIKEGKQAVKMTRLICHRFRSNEVRLWLSVIAYNLGKPMAATGAAQQNQQLVAYQRAAATGENRRPPGEARTVLLAFLGGEPSDPTLIRNDAAADLCAAGPHRLTRGECDEAGGKERAQGWSGVREMPRYREFRSLHVSANRAEGLPSREIVPRGTLWLTWKGLGHIRLPIWAAKMEIPLEARSHSAPLSL
jgi:hypothetical protein